MKTKKIVMAALAALALTGSTAAGPAQAEAACGGGVTYNRAGEGAWFGNVQPMNGMNCASARYVVNKWRAGRTRAAGPTACRPGSGTAR